MRSSTSMPGSMPRGTSGPGSWVRCWPCPDRAVRRRLVPEPAAGPWIVGQLFTEGQRELADEIAARVAGRPLSFAPVIAAVELLVDDSEGATVAAGCSVTGAVPAWPISSVPGATVIVHWC